MEGTCPRGVTPALFLSPIHTHFLFFFFFNDAAPPETYPLPLPDALPILERAGAGIDLGAADGLGAETVGAALARAARTRRALAPAGRRLVDGRGAERVARHLEEALREDRKSTRLNSSHLVISYAVFCLKK